MNNYIGWHIELTRRCPLRCPACLRTTEFDSKVIDPKKDIDFDDLKNFFQPNSLKDIKYMLLQGNLGDPIYHPRFHKIAEWFFAVQELQVVTNGMHTESFWQQTLESWPKNSKIILSIDGLEDTNHLYRIGSNWEKIEKLFELISKGKHKCLIEWKYIVFKHNHHQVEKAEQLASKIGIDFFRIQKTRKLDPLLDIKEYHNDEWFKYKTIEYEDKISPFCFTGDMHYIDAFGNYYPCCWWADTNRQKNYWEPINIKNNSVESFKNNFLKFAKCLNSYDRAPMVCKNFCRTIKNNNSDMITPNTQLNRNIKKLK